jgi:Bacterial membrane protein YfhO
LSSIASYKIAGVSLSVYAILLLVCLGVYWPVSTGLFSLKNDAIVYFLPYRYHVSECIQSGQLPFWSPYIYMGFPLHGDMQSGAWNPFVIFISLFTRYNLTVLHIESLLYVFIAGIGMYKLLSAFNLNEKTKIVSAIGYMCCGFITDSGQFIVWLGSAAFVPFVLLYYYRILYQPQLRNTVKTAIALLLLLTAGYPSFFIFCAYIMLAGFIIRTLQVFREKNTIVANKKIFLLQHLWLILFIAALALPALISYAQLLPEYERGSGTTLQKALSNPFNPFCSISYLTPMAVTKEHPFIHTDLSARNAFAGLFTLVFFIAALQKKLTGMQRFALGVLIFSFLFSLGDATPLRGFCYRFMPLMDTFRHPANMRLFTTIALFLIAAFSLHHFFERPSPVLTPYRLSALAILLLLIGLMGIYFSDAQLIPGMRALMSAIKTGGDKRIAVKAIAENFSFADYLIVQAFIQSVFLVFFFIWTRKKIRPGLITALFIANIILAAEFSIPATFVSKQSPAAMNELIDNSVHGFPLPDMKSSLSENNKDENWYQQQYELGGFYSKKSTIQHNVITPSFLKIQDRFLWAISLQNMVSGYPVAYCPDSIIQFKDTGTIAGIDLQKKYLFTNELTLEQPNQHTIKAIAFGPNRLAFELNTEKATYLVIQQNYHKAWKATVDGKAIDIVPVNIAFMAVPVQPGRHSIALQYQPAGIKPAIFVAILAVIFILFLFIVPAKFKTKLNW